MQSKNYKSADLPSSLNAAPFYSVQSCSTAPSISGASSTSGTTSGKLIRCDQCGIGFKTKISLKRHMVIHRTQINCPICGKTFKSTLCMKRHHAKHENVVHCIKCNMDISKQDWGHHLRTRLHKERSNSSITTTFSPNIIVRSSDFMERVEVYTCMNPKEEIFIEEFFQTIEADVIRVLEEALKKHISFKCNFELECKYIKYIGKEEEEEEKICAISHNTKMLAVRMLDKMPEVCLKKFKEIESKMSDFQERDSGWALLQISCLNININQHNIIRGSSYIKLPHKLSKTKACVNIKNDDVYCFKWSIIAGIRRPSNIKEINMCSSYNIANIESNVIEVDNIKLNFEHMKFPVDIKDIKIFENQNPNISINVFGFDNKGDQIVGPYYLCEKEKGIHLSLMLLEDDDCTKRHYILIRDLSR